MRSVSSDEGNSGAHTMTAHDLTTVLSGYSFLEAPRWHHGRIWCSDFYTHQVVSASEDGSELRVEARVPGQPAGLGWLPDGRLLVVSMRDRLVLRREPDQTLLVHADLSAEAAGHANDMIVDSQGRAYVGNFGFDLMHGEPLEPTVLHRIDPDGSIRTVARDLWFPNGCAITTAGTLLVNETFGNRVTAFDLGSDGTLVNRRVWAEFGPLPTDRAMEQVLSQVVVAGDGACIDAEDALWIADAIGSRLLRVEQGGRITDEVHLTTNVYACALGGARGNTLFACVAPDFDESARSQHRDGSVVSLNVRVPAPQPF